MKKMIITLLALVMFMPTINVKAISDIKINSTNFPDYQFRKAIKENLDINHDQWLSIEEIRKADTLIASGFEIKSVEGLRYLTYLKTLDLSDNPITELDVNYNRRLTQLDVEKTKLTKVTNISKLTNLETVRVSKKLMFNQNLENVKAKKIIVDADDIYLVAYDGKFPLKYINSKWDLTKISTLDDLEKADSKYITGFVEGENEGTLRYKRKDGGTLKVIFEYEAIKFPRSLIITQKAEKKSPYTCYANLTWKAPSEAVNGYEIYRSTSSNGTYKKIATTTNTYYADKTAKIGKKYYYRARAYFVEQGHKIYTKFTAKKNIKLELGDTYLKVSYAEPFGDFTLSWKQSEGAQGYEIYKSAESNGKYKKYKTIDGGDTTSWYFYYSNDSALYFYYKIRPYAQYGDEKIYGNFSSPLFVYDI